MPRTLVYASALGASAVRAVGTTDGVFRADEAEAFVAAHELARWRNGLRIDVRMPDLSATEGSDILVRRWLVAEGARVKRGEPLLEVETDKATTEVESVATGTVAEILRGRTSRSRSGR